MPRIYDVRLFTTLFDGRVQSARKRVLAGSAIGAGAKAVRRLGRGHWVHAELTEGLVLRRGRPEAVLAAPLIMKRKGWSGEETNWIAVPHIEVPPGHGSLDEPSRAQMASGRDSASDRHRTDLYTSEQRRDARKHLTAGAILFTIGTALTVYDLSNPDRTTNEWWWWMFIGYGAFLLALGTMRTIGSRSTARRLVGDSVVRKQAAVLRRELSDG